MISNLRIAALLFGVLGVISAFVVYRGAKWNKVNFLLFSAMGLGLVVVSINPESINIVRDVLALEEYAYGRLLGLLVLSVVFLLFHSFIVKTKLERLHSSFDVLTRNLAAETSSSSLDFKDAAKSIMVIIPALNEADNLRELLPKMPRSLLGMETGVLVVDDGSTDGTRQVAEELGAKVVSMPMNRGQGASCRLGYYLLSRQGVRYGVTMDADNQHRPEDLERMLEPVVRGRLDVSIGSRILGASGRMNFLRSLGVRLFSLLVSLGAGVRITDCSSGFKAFDMDKLRNVNLLEDQFQSAEFIFQTVKSGLVVGEVPISIDERMHGSSKKGMDIQYGARFAKSIIKSWWR